MTDTHLVQPATLIATESWALPSQLDGSAGRNRADGRAQISASDDRSAVLVWLSRFRSSPATWSSYRKEAERLLLWCVMQERKALSDLTHEDLLRYQSFLLDPQPEALWVLRGRHKPSRSSPQWRPFAGPLSPASQRQAMSILNSLFSWLVEAGYLAGNPLALSRRLRRVHPPRMTRYLPPAHWAEILSTIEALDVSSHRKVLQAARLRWMFSLLYIGALRASELTEARMSNFFRRLDTTGRERWWLEVLGKGQKLRLIPVTDELKSELIRYRACFGLTELPSPTEDLPLVMALNRKGAASPEPLSRSCVHHLVKFVVESTAKRLRSRGEEWEGMARHIEKASAHWFRHTAGSHLSESADLKVVRDHLGHANISTTSIYLHTEDDARHDATSRGLHLAWKTP